jgi:O-antigen/teichoic acid export membrane protein
MSGRAAAVNDAIWVVVTAVLVIPAWIVGTETAIVACWGGGAVAAAIAGFVQTRRRPARLLVSLRWWRVATWPFARWLAGAQTLSLTASALTVVALTAILGPEALGGLRAAQSLFAPMTLLGPAIGLPGLPALTRALGISSRTALAMATRLSAVVVAITGLYVALMAVVGPSLIPLLFGKSFSQFEDLWLPTGVWQLIGGVGLGFGLLLTAKQRGRDLISARLVESLAAFGFIVLLSWRSGLNGAAWGYACGAAVGSLALTWYAVASREEGVNNPAISGGATRL